MIALNAFEEEHLKNDQSWNGENSNQNIVMDGKLGRTA